MNLYVHFPFCGGKCTYCALHSVAGSRPETRAAYVNRLADELAGLPPPAADEPLTVYFGGGTPTLCDLVPLFPRIARLRAATSGPFEFTVELHPRTVTPELLAALRAGGVNRLSLGVQSLDDAALAAMNRRHTAAEAETAFRAIRSAGFANAGLDLIAGWPGTSDASWRRTLDRALDLGLDHCSVYTLIREPKTKLDLDVRKGRVVLPDDEAALAQLDAARAALADAGLVRYEISNYARPGFECRHNCAVWRGEDYVGLGEGAHGRQGLVRTVGTRTGYETETLDARADAHERALFALRVRTGLDLAATVARWPVLTPEIPRWRAKLRLFAEEGLARETGENRFALTDRGFEVCDAILAELLG